MRVNQTVWNVFLLLVALLLSTTCTLEDKEKEKTKKDAISQTADSISQEVIGELEANLVSSSLQLNPALATARTFQNSDSDEILRRQTTTALTQEQIDKIVTAAETEILQMGLNNSEDLIAIMPEIIAGAMAPLAELGLADTGAKVAVIKVIASSAMTSLNGRNDNLPAESAEEGQTPSETVLQNIAASIVGNIDATGIEVGNVPAALSDVVGEIVTNLGSSSLGNAEELEGAVGVITSGAAKALGNITIAGFNADKLPDVVGKITEGATGGLGKITMTGYSVDNLPAMMSKITEGATGGLGKITMTGYSADNLPAMMSKITEGATGGLGKITMTGYSADNLPAMVSKITEGATGGLGKITMTGYSADNLPAMMSNITKGATSGLGSIVMESYSVDKLPEMMNNITKGATGGLGKITMTGYSVDNLPAMMSKITEGATGGLGNIVMTGFSVDQLPGMMTKITEGATRGLGNIVMAGYSTDKLPDMMTKITEGAAGALGNIAMPGYSVANLGGLMTKITEGATVAMSGIEMEGFDATKAVVLVTNITKGATNALSNISMVGFDNTQAGNLMTNISTGAQNALGKVEIQGFDRTAALNNVNTVKNNFDPSKITILAPPTVPLVSYSICAANPTTTGCVQLLNPKSTVIAGTTMGTTLPGASTVTTTGTIPSASTVTTTGTIPSTTTPVATTVTPTPVATTVTPTPVATTVTPTPVATTVTAADTTAPTVSATNPASSATGVAISSAITATFNETMTASTVTTATFTIGGVTGTVTYSGTTATFTPSSSLSYATTYTATITTGVKDSAGNALAANRTWTFTTASAPDTTAPTVSSTNPASSATGIAISSAITATFSETMTAVTTATFTIGGVTGTVAYSGTTATFTPSSSLSYSTVYTATITTGVKDSAGNALAANYIWTFTTAADTTAPTDGTLSATAGNAQVSLSWSGFSDAGGIASYKLVYSTSSSPSCSSGTLIYSGTSAGYTHSSLSNGTTYYYRLCAIDNATNTSSGAAKSAMPLIFMGGSLQGHPLALATAVSTLAGTAGSAGSTDGTGSAARFSFPTDITTDRTNLYVIGNTTIRKIVISSGVVTTFAGAKDNYSSADGTGTAARFNTPLSITTDGTNLYVADSSNHTIRKIVISSAAVTTLAGTSWPISSGSTDGTGSAARFNTPLGITTDGTNLYVADTNNNTIRKIVISTGVVTTLAGAAGSSGSTDGTGSAARFNAPGDLTTDGTNLYVTDYWNSTIRKIVISSAVVTTLAGTAGSAGSTDGTGSAARFRYPEGIDTDGTNLYVGDSSSDTIRKIVISTAVVTTLAGTASSTGSTDGTGSAARFNSPKGITTDGGSLYVADCWNHTIRQIQ